MTREDKLNVLRDDIIKKIRDLENARNAYDFAKANATDDPEPQADDVETIRDDLKDAYRAGWGDGYKAKGVEPDWIDEGFARYEKTLSPAYPHP
jgi:hypothetical protein